MADFRNKSHCSVILWLETYSIWFQNKMQCNLTASYYYATWNSLSFNSVSSLNPWTCKCTLTCTFLQDDDHTFTISGRLDANGLAVNETIEAESIPGLQVIWLLKEEIRKHWLFNMQQNKTKKSAKFSVKWAIHWNNYSNAPVDQKFVLTGSQTIVKKEAHSN